MSAGARVNPDADARGRLDSVRVDCPEKPLPIPNSSASSDSTSGPSFLQQVVSAELDRISSELARSDAGSAEILRSASGEILALLQRCEARTGLEKMKGARLPGRSLPTSALGANVRPPSADAGSSECSPRVEADHAEPVAPPPGTVLPTDFVSALVHELSQPITASLNFMRGCIRRLQNRARGSDDSDLLQALLEAARQGEHAARVLRSLRSFVRGRRARVVVADLNDLVSEAVRLARPGVEEAGVAIRCAMAPEYLAVEVERVQIEAVMLNLIRNGCEALREVGRPERVLEIRTLRCPGNRVELVVLDHGPGAAGQLRERMFDPFFTTKAGGTGLGLPISRALIEANGGRLWATAEPIGGTSLHLSLPGARSHEPHG